MVTGILIARLLGPEGRGQFFLAVTIVGAVQQFGALGLHSSNVYQVAANRELFPQLASNSLWISALVGIASLPIMLVGIPYFFPVIDGVMAVMIAIAVPPSLYFLLAGNLLLGVDRVRAFNGMELLSRLLPLIFIVAFLLVMDLTVHAAMLSSVASMIVCVVVMLRFVSPGALLRFDTTLFKGSVSYGIRAYLAALLGFLVARAGGILLGARGDAVQVGHLSIALQLADFMLILPATIGLILFPRLVGDQYGRARKTYEVSKIVAAIMACTCAVAWLAAGLLIPLVFGQAYAESVAVFRGMLPGIFALGLISILSQYLAAHGIPWKLIYGWVGGFAIMAAGSWILIPTYGALGVAIATSVAYCVICAVLIILSIKITHH